MIPSEQGIRRFKHLKVIIPMLDDPNSTQYKQFYTIMQNLEFMIN